MKSSATPSSWFSYIPALSISVLILIIAGILGGPIAAAISAFAVLPSLLTSIVITFFALSRYSPSNKRSALGVGFVLYLISTIVILICLNEFGPSQIM